MRTAVWLTWMLSVSLVAQPTPALPLPIREVNQKFLKSCADGEKLFMKLREGDESVKDDLLNLVIRLEYDLIIELESRTKAEIGLLKPARICTKSVAERVRIYVRQVSRKTAQISEKSEFQ